MAQRLTFPDCCGGEVNSEGVDTYWDDFSVSLFPAKRMGGSHEQSKVPYGDFFHSDDVSYPHVSQISCRLEAVSHILH